MREVAEMPNDSSFWRNCSAGSICKVRPVSLVSDTDTSDSNINRAPGMCAA